MNQGWKCPNCGGCYSPTTPQCFNCKGRTEGTNTTTPFFPYTIGDPPEFGIQTTSSNKWVCQECGKWELKGTQGAIYPTKCENCGKENTATFCEGYIIAKEK